MFNWTIQWMFACIFDHCNTKNKTDQDASAWGTEGLVLTDVGSAKTNGFDSLIF